MSTRWEGSAPARNRWLLGAAVTAMAGAWGGGVAAADANTAAQFGGTSVLPEIIVTARKWVERVQDVPDSITAFTAERIVRANITNVRDVALQTPNVSVVEAQQPGTPLFNVRGIGQARGGEAPIAVVVDGVQMANAAEITQDLFDIERIEVLKGPQGAVYGRNAIGGAINIVTRPPSNEFEGAVQLGYGTGDDYRAWANVSGPIIPDKVLFRLAGYYRDFGGDIPSLNTPGRDEANWERDEDIRGALLLKPVDHLTVDLRYSRLDTTGGAAYYAPVVPPATIDTPLPYIGDVPGRAQRVLDDASAKVEYDLGKALISSITAYTTTHTSLHEDLDFSPLSLLIADQTLKADNFSQELRISSSGEGPLKWMGGVYYLNTRQKLDTKIFLGADYLNLIGLPPSLAPFQVSGDLTNDTNNAYAAFGQASYRLASRLELTGALRYDIDQRHQTDLIAAGNPQYRHTFTSLQPKASISYFFTPDEMIYATIAKGFRSGGFNPNDRITRLFKAESDWNYEAGFKTSLDERRVTLDGAVFYTDYTDRQTYILDIETAAQVITNPIPKAEIYGAELELAARPLERLDLDASVGLLHSKILQYDPSVFAGLPPSGNYTGNQLSQMPTVSYAFSAQYAEPVGPDTTLTPRVEVNGSGGDYYWEIDNLHKRKAINLVNARLILAHKAASVTVFAENLFDEKYVQEYVDKAWSGGAQDYSAAARGRRFGVYLRYVF